MKALSSLTVKGFRRTFLAVYALSSLLPLLFFVYLVYDHIFPIQTPEQMDMIRTTVTVGLIGMLLVPLLGFVLMLWWIRSLEGLTREVKVKTAEVTGKKSDSGDENEMMTLRNHFEDLYSELQEKIRQINEYSHRLIDDNIKLSEMAVTDELTGLYNRRHFEERLIEESSRVVRHRQELSMIMIDVDGFKKYNDEKGHPAGDEILRTLGHLIRASIRKSDLPFRYGGDEFAILLPQCGPKDAGVIAKKLVRAVGAQEFGLDLGEQHRISISCGVAPFVDNATDFVQTADRCLYKAKSSGKGRVFLAATKPLGKEDKDTSEEES